MVTYDVATSGENLPFGDIFKFFGNLLRVYLVIDKNSSPLLEF